MTTERIERRLAAIMAADVAGYSQLMGVDEVGTLTALKEHRRERVDPAIARHHGRIVKATGDGLLVEFPSVVDAVACAVAIQRAMLAFNAGVHVDRRIVFRIGINVGDVIIDGDDIFGDGVNVAARLEALCEPGGVCISRSANEQVRDKLRLGFADLGEQTVKNIARAVGVFGLAAKDIEALPEEALPKPEPPGLRTPLAPARRRKSVPIITGVAVLAVILAAGGWWLLHGTTAPPASTAGAQAPAQDRRQSVIVLPFENTSGDPAQDGLAAGITRELTERITLGGDGPVIPAMTAAAYRGKAVDLRAVGHEQDVHFAVTGNARRENGRLIVSAAVYETTGGNAVWTGQLDRPDAPGAQRGIVQVIYENYWQASVDTEVGRAMHDHPDQLDERDLMLRVMSTRLAATTKEHYQERMALVARALALDPTDFAALERQARLHAEFVLLGFSSDPADDLAIAAKAADHLFLLNANALPALRAKATVLRAQRNWIEAEIVLRRAIALQPTEATRRFELGTILIVQGRHQEALESFQLAKQLAGGSDPVNLFDGYIAMTSLATGKPREAIEAARLAVSEAPPGSGRAAEIAWLALIAAESEIGEDDAAHADLQKFLATARVWHNMAEVEKWAGFAANPKLIEGLRRAGMPEA